MPEEEKKAAKKTPEDWGEIEGVRPPIIKIKKDAVKEPELHYDREERLSMHSASKPKEIRGFFRTFLGFGQGGSRRRGRISPLFPVLLIAVAAIFIIRTMSGSRGGESIAGYGATLRADPYEGSLLVSVSFKPPTRRPAVAPTATVRFILPDTGEELILSGDLAGEAPAIRGKMHYTGKEKSIKAEVRIGSQTKTLTASIRPPSG
jgi:hypothetical protein